MYYKIPLILLVCFLFLLASGIRNAVTQKCPVVYLAYLNISAGEDIDGYLSDGFVSYLGRDPEKEEVYRYYNLYLSDNPSAENHQYAYTSNLKLLAAINAKQLDLLLMNKEAYDLCSANGYLLDLTSLYSSNSPSNADMQALITENLVIQEDSHSGGQFHRIQSRGNRFLYRCHTNCGQCVEREQSPPISTGRIFRQCLFGNHCQYP